MENNLSNSSVDTISVDQIIEFIDNINITQQHGEKCIRTLESVALTITKLDNSSPIRKYDNFDALAKSSKRILEINNLLVGKVREDTKLEPLHVVIAKISRMILTTKPTSIHSAMYKRCHEVSNALIDKVKSSAIYLTFKSSHTNIISEYRDAIYPLTEYITRCMFLWAQLILLSLKEDTKESVTNILQQVSQRKDTVDILIPDMQ